MTEPQKARSPGLQSEAFAEHSLNVVDFAAARDSCKALATLKAKFALAGHQVHHRPNRSFMVSRWGLTRYCDNESALKLFARQLGILP